jgi:hypothetical protein
MSMHSAPYVQQPPPVGVDNDPNRGLYPARPVPQLSGGPAQLIPTVPGAVAPNAVKKPATGPAQQLPMRGTPAMYRRGAVDSPFMG